MDLYNRQSNLTLKKYSVCFVVGCGGIGNWVALDLALSGCVKELVLIDPDTIEDSNLNRTIFDTCDIGCYKVDAVARHILLKRESQKISIVADYLNENMVQSIIDKYFGGDNSYYRDKICVVDCRDDIYDDCYSLNCKLYKVGYDGCEITIDGNPRLTKVYGQRGGTYTVTPSYVCSSQLAAILVVNDMLYPRVHRMYDNNIITHQEYNSINNIGVDNEGDYPYLHNRDDGNDYDHLGRLNQMINIDTTKLISTFCDNEFKISIPSIEIENPLL